MSPKQIKDKINSLQTSIRISIKEIEELRKNCPHQDRIDLSSDDPESEKLYVCNTCGHVFASGE